MDLLHNRHLQRLLLTASLFFTVLPSAEAAEARPNILIVLTDDQGWASLGSYGGKIVPTPNLDGLARASAQFTDAYVTSQCTPTRATLLTGQYTARHGLWHVLSWYGYPYARMTEPMFLENYSRDTFTIAKGLRSAGYRTSIVGKWHLTSNRDGNYMGLFPHAAEHYGFDFAPPVLDKDQFAPGADRGVQQLTDQAIAFIKRNRQRPWFCLLSHHMIHGKVVAPESLTRKYRDLGYGDDGPNRAVYLAGLECIDRSMGRLMSCLEENNLTERTVVIFLSDNGGVDTRLNFRDVDLSAPENTVFKPDVREYDNAPLRAGKGSIYEGGVRVPMIVRWPGRVAAGSIVQTPVHVVDLLPTCFEVAGAMLPEDHPMDGRSLLTLLTNGTDPALASRPLYQYYPFYDLRWGLTPSAAIRIGDYKLIEFFGDRVDESGRYHPGHRLELYDLRNDIGETQNLARKQSARASTLHRQLHQWMREVGAATPERNARYDPSRAFEETREKPSWLEGSSWTAKEP